MAREATPLICIHVDSNGIRCTKQKRILGNNPLAIAPFCENHDKLEMRGNEWTFCAHPDCWRWRTPSTFSSCKCSQHSYSGTDFYGGTPRAAEPIVIAEINARIQYPHNRTPPPQRPAAPGHPCADQPCLLRVGSPNERCPNHEELAAARRRAAQTTLPRPTTITTHGMDGGTPGSALLRMEGALLHRGVTPSQTQGTPASTDPRPEVAVRYPAETPRRVVRAVIEQRRCREESCDGPMSTGCRRCDNHLTKISTHDQFPCLVRKCPHKPDRRRSFCPGHDEFYTAFVLARTGWDTATLLKAFCEREHKIILDRRQNDDEAEAAREAATRPAPITRQEAQRANFDALYGGIEVPAPSEENPRVTIARMIQVALYSEWNSCFEQQVRTLVQTEMQGIRQELMTRMMALGEATETTIEESLKPIAEAVDEIAARIKAKAAPEEPQPPSPPVPETYRVCETSGCGNPVEMITEPKCRRCSFTPLPLPTCSVPGCTKPRVDAFIPKCNDCYLAHLRAEMAHLDEF